MYLVVEEEGILRGRVNKTVRSIDASVEISILTRFDVQS